MFRKLALLLSMMLIFSLVLVACGGDETEEPADEPAVEEPADEPADEPAEEPAEEPADEPAEEPMEEPSGEKTVLDFGSFTDELNTMAVAYMGMNPDVEIDYTMIPMTAGEYQTKLLASLGTDDSPDLIALEAAFVKEYVESDFLADVGDLMQYAEEAGTYQFVIDVGTDDGVTKAYAFQATPGAFFYRRSLAEEYLGTSDPVEIQALLGDFDKFTEAAATIKEASNGDTYMVASNGDFTNLFFANRDQPWIVDGEMVIDPKVDEYIAVSKTFRDEDYEAQATQWQEGWFAGMNDTLVDAEGNAKQIFGYFLPTWGLPYVLAPNAVAAEGSSDTSGDWGVIEGPLPYQWGGTWIGALAESPNLAAAKDFIRFATLDMDNLRNWATGVYTNEYLTAIDPDFPPEQAQAPGDFVSSKVVVDEIISLFDDSDLSAFLGGQNSYGGFAAAAPSVNASLMTGADDAIQRAMQDPMNQYLNGEISVEDMYAAWKDAVRIEFPDLIIN